MAGWLLQGLFCWLLVAGETRAQALTGATLPLKAVQAGSAAFNPADTPLLRVDANSISSAFGGVGSLDIVSLGAAFTGTAVAISPWHVLTAGHNLDADDNGVVDPGIQITFSLNFGGDRSHRIPVAQYSLNPAFSGFLNPGISGDLGLLRLSQALPPEVPIYGLWPSPVEIGQPVTFVGYGQSGSGDFGYSVGASLVTKRVGANVIDSFQKVGGRNEVFLYDFDPPSTVGLPSGSLGNVVESIIGPGDSGSPLLILFGGQYYLAGINTFTQGGNHGRFGDQGGGILVEPHLAWIESTVAIPEPEHAAALLALATAAYAWVRRCGPPARGRPQVPFPL